MPPRFAVLRQTPLAADSRVSTSQYLVHLDAWPHGRAATLIETLMLGKWRWLLTFEVRRD
jgi:hypothetical protein